MQVVTPGRRSVSASSSPDATRSAELWHALMPWSNGERTAHRFAHGLVGGNAGAVAIDRAFATVGRLAARLGEREQSTRDEDQ